MSGSETALVLAEGYGLVLGGVEWTVAEFRPQVGRVVLRQEDGTELATTIRMLVSHADCRPSTNNPAMPAHSRGRQPAGLADLTVRQRELVMLRHAHVMEAETGYRSGDPLRPRPGEPRPGYDPATTTLMQRRETKVAELRALPAEDAKMLGLGRVSVRSLSRWTAAVDKFGIPGLISGNWVRATGTHPSLGPEVREAIFAVRAETLLRSRIDMRTREGLIHQYVREKFGPQVQVPSYWTLRRIWREWFGPGGTRQRYAGSEADPPSAGEHVLVHRPGQVVALDTTEMAVLVREGVFGEPVAAHLTIALDLYSHSIVAFRLTLVSEKSVDVAMLLRDVMMPLPMRDGWGEDMEWPYPGIPAEVVAGFAGQRVAGLPFFAPETVTTDHGSVFKNHHLVDVQRVIGANILPARVLRPTDKAACERAFGAIQTLLLEWLLGYRGVDVADRGQDVEADAVLTLAEMEHLIATWIVKIWQNRKLGEFAPAWDPDTRHSPNTLFAAAMEQGGFALQIPRPELYYELLPTHNVLLEPQRGVKIKGLWYGGPALDQGYERRSDRGGRHRQRWVIRSDPRDRRYAFFQDPRTHEWHTLRWNGLPAVGEIPAFSDLRAGELLQTARARGLKPKSDAELLPLLLELIGGHIPVSDWPSQMPRKKRKDYARQVEQGRAATADRPGEAGSRAAAPAEDVPAASTASARKELTVPAWRDHADQAVRLVEDELRSRREAVARSRAIAPPPRLGQGGRRSLLEPPADPLDSMAGEPADGLPAEKVSDIGGAQGAS